MSTVYGETTRNANDVLYLIQSAVAGEIARLELALMAAKQRLVPFEQKYNVTSKYFISEMTAEDLEDQDDEYVHWAGEYRLMERLQEKLQSLHEIS
ncbi:MAG: hypothetical protein ABIG63_18065 [Chloroflexota bacterium]